MPSLVGEKLAQAKALMASAPFDLWLTFVRETAEGSDPILPFLADGGFTWQSALMITRTGKTIAVVGRYDADPLRAAGHWDEIIGYDASFRDALLATFDAHVPEGGTIGLNYSLDNSKADGLTLGLFRALESAVAGTRHAGQFVSAQPINEALRALKTPEEIRRMRHSISVTLDYHRHAQTLASQGLSERAIYDAIQSDMDAQGYGYGWDRHGNPIVNSGPDSMIGHGIPSEKIHVAPGHIFHVDLGVIIDDYSSDIQRCAYILEPGETVLPLDVQSAFEAVKAAIRAGASEMKPGALGYVCDAAARAELIARGYPEYQHALGHQVGRAAHDGGAVLGPQWERYGTTVTTPLRANEVYTVELGITVPGRGYLGLEEMVLVTESGIEWLTELPSELPLIRVSS